MAAGDIEERQRNVKKYRELLKGDEEKVLNFTGKPVKGDRAGSGRRFSPKLHHYV